MPIYKEYIRLVGKRPYFDLRHTTTNDKRPALITASYMCIDNMIVLDCSVCRSKKVSLHSRSRGCSRVDEEHAHFESLGGDSEEIGAKVIKVDYLDRTAMDPTWKQSQEFDDRDMNHVLAIIMAGWDGMWRNMPADMEAEIEALYVLTDCWKVVLLESNSFI